jgi:multiple sugar transport system permease protein
MKKHLHTKDNPMKKKGFTMRKFRIECIRYPGSFLFPVYWTTITSLKTEQEIFRLPPTFFPLKINTESYIVQFRSGDYNMFRSFLNSFIISISAMLIAVVLAVPASYGLARYQFRGKKIFVLGFLVTQMLPVSVVLTPLFILFKNMRLINSPLSVILADATIGIPFSILILQNYFSAIPKDIEEAAYIDGCNRFLTFMLILIPVAIPGIIVCAVFSFLYAWGDLAFGMTFIQEQFKRPITSGIFNFIGRYGIQWSYLCAFAVVTIIPVAIIFILMQKYIISGITSGAVKD